MVTPSSTDVTTTYTPQEPSAASKTLTATGQATILDVTEEGLVHFVTIENTTGTAGNTATVKLKFTVDGGTATNVTVMSAAATFADWALACPGTGDGQTNNDRRELPISFTYKVSLKVEIDVTVAAFALGTMKATVVRSKKV